MAEDVLYSYAAVGPNGGASSHDLQYRKTPYVPRGALYPLSDAIGHYFRRLAALAKLFLAHRGRHDSSIAKSLWMKAMRSTPHRELDHPWRQYRAEIHIWQYMTHQVLSNRVSIYSAVAHKREDQSLWSSQRAFASWTDQAYKEKGAATVFRYVRSTSAASSFVLAGSNPVAGGRPEEVVSMSMHIDEAVQLQAQPWQTLWQVQQPQLPL